MSRKTKQRCLLIIALAVLFINIAITDAADNGYFFKLEQKDGRWIFTKGDEEFFSLGVCSVGGTYGNPYIQKALKKQYKKIDDFYEGSLDILKGLNFDTLGAWSADGLEKIAKEKKFIF